MLKCGAPLLWSVPYSFPLYQAKYWGHVLSSLCMALLICASSLVSVAQIGIITTIAGGGPNNVPADEAHLLNPTDVVTDLQGNVYVVTSIQNELFRIGFDSGILTAAAGNDTPGFSGDNGPATLASMSSPYGLAIDNAGNIFIGDSGNNRVRRVDAITHLITTYAGGGIPCTERTDSLGDGCAAINATLSFPSGLAVDGAGNLLIADVGNNLIRRVDAVTGMITPFVGGLLHPFGVSTDGRGNVFIVDTGNNRVLKTDTTTSFISIVAGGGPLCASRTDSVGDGCLATNALLNRPVRAVADIGGNLFIAETNGNRIRRVDATSSVITTALASLTNPIGINFDRAGNLLIADSQSGRLLQLDVATNVIATLAGANGPSDYDLPALQANLTGVGQVVIDGAENVFFSESCCTILRLDSVSHLLSKIAGSEFGGPDINSILGLARDSADHLFVADETAIRRVDSVTGVITTVVGNGRGCAQETDNIGDGCPATDASILPQSVAVDDLGNLFIGDGGFGGFVMVRRVDAMTQIITLLAGSGSGCAQQINDIGDGCPATQVHLDAVRGVAVDSAGNVLIATGSRIRRVDALTQVITTVAGDGDEAYSGDNGLATSAGVTAGHVAVDAVGNFFITGDSRVRRVDAVTNVITTVAGNGISGFSGDGGPATEASIQFFGIASIDDHGNLFIGDGANFRVRKVALGLPAMTASATSLSFRRVRVGRQATQKITLTNTGTALLEFFDIAASGTFVESNSCGSGVEPGAECEIDITFTPAQRGHQTGNLTIKPNVAGGNTSIPLSGTGIGHAKHQRERGERDTDFDEGERAKLN